MEKEIRTLKGLERQSDGNSAQYFEIEAIPSYRGEPFGPGSVSISSNRDVGILVDR